MDNANQKVFVVFNPKAGKEDQAEVIGHTPVEARLVPRAIHVIMPKAARAAAAN